MQNKCRIEIAWVESQEDDAGGGQSNSAKRSDRRSLKGKTVP
jgi:hypothetical protein